MDIVFEWIRVIASIVTALAAFFSAWAARKAAFFAKQISDEQNKIHKNSYKPYCDICCVDYDNKISIKIKNNGTGVMTIKSFEVHNRNNDIVYNNLFSCIDKEIKLTYYSVDIKNRSIKPSGEMKLIEKKIIDENGDEVEQFDKLRRELNQYIIRVEFSDMYNDPDTYEKDLSLIYCGKHRN